MSLLQLGAIVNSVVSNCLTALASSTVREYRVARAIHRAIRATAKDCRFLDAQDVLTVWAAAVFADNDLEAFRNNGAAAAVDKYREIANLRGSPSDEGTASEVIQCFLLHVDDLILTLAGHDEREEVRFRLLTTGIQSLQAQGTDILSRLPAVGNASLDVSVSTNAQHALIQALIDAGQFRAAREKLNSLARNQNDRVEDTASRLMLEGVCSYHDDDYAAALDAFVAARTLNPVSGKIVSNIAAAHLSLGNYERALSEARVALDLAPEMPPVNLIAALHATGQYEEAIAIARNERWRDDPDVLIACSRILHDLGRWLEALNSARASVAIKASVDGKELVAVILLSQNGMTKTRTPLRDIREAISLLTECIADNRTAENPEHLHRLYVNRAAANGLAGDYDRSLADSDAALQILRSDEALAAKARACGAKDDWRQAVEVFAAIKDPGLLRQVAHAHAYALVHAKREREGLDLALKHLANPDIQDGDFLTLAHIAILASRSLRDDKALAGIEAAGAGRANWVTAGVRGYRLLHSADPEHAVDELTTAADTAPPAERDVLALNIVRTLLRIGRPHAAARLCERFRDCATDVQLAEAYASALYRCRDFRRLDALCDEMELAGTESPSLRESRARLFEEAGDLHAAAAVYEALDDIDALLRAALLRARLQQFGEVASLVSRIDLKDVKDEPRNLMIVACLHDALGRDPMPLAYRALQLATRPEEVAEYVRLASKWVTVRSIESTVVSGTTVVLAGGSRATVTVSDEPLDEGLPWHVSSTSARGRRLIGKGVGDRTSFGLAGQQFEFVIESVANKYHHALADAIETAPARFDKAAPVAPLPSGNIPVSPRREELNLRYAAQQISIGRLADLTSGGPTRAFNSALLHDGRVNAFTGNEDDANEQRAVLMSCSAIVLDITSLLTLARLDMLNLLLNAFSDVHVTQFVLDDLWLSQLRVFAFRPDGVVRLARPTSSGPQPFDWDHYSEERDCLSRAIQFVVEKCKVVACRALVTAPRRSLVADAKIFGRVSVTSFLLAQNSDTPLVIDDVVSQRAAANRNVRVASSHAILQVLRKRDLLSREKYGRALLKLRELNCQFLSVAVEDLYHFVETASAPDNAEFIQLASQLADPVSDVASVIAVASALLAKICVSNLPDQRKVSATTATLILSALNRPIEVVARIRGRVLTDLAHPWSRSGGRLSRNIQLFIRVFRDFEIAVETAFGNRRVGKSRGKRPRDRSGTRENAIA